MVNRDVWGDKMDELELIDRNREKVVGGTSGSSVLGKRLVPGEEIPIGVLRWLCTRVGWTMWHFVVVMSCCVLLGFFIGVNW